MAVYRSGEQAIAETKEYKGNRFTAGKSVPDSIIAYLYRPCCCIHATSEAIIHHACLWICFVATAHYIMTSSNDNISALLALCEGNPPVTGGFPSQRPVMLSFDVFFDLSWDKQLSKQSGHQWFKRHCAHSLCMKITKWVNKWNK